METPTTPMDKATQVDFERFLNDLKAVVRDGQDLLKTSVQGIRTRAEEGLKTTGQKVRENPYRSMGMVFGLGVVVGILAVSMMRGGESEED